MKIIDNRYKIDENLYNDFFVDAYKVEDLWKSNNIKYMKVYHYNLQKELIDYFVNNQIKIASIRHKNLLHSEEFYMVQTIDTKNTNITMYYSISEFVNYEKLKDKIHTLKFEERLRVLLDIVLVIDFLHFRGYAYKFLNPLQVCLLDGNIVKLQNLASIVEKNYLNEYNEFEREFLSPEFFADNKNNNKTQDYYSIAEMIKYLFFNKGNLIDWDHNTCDPEKSTEFFSNMISNLKKHSLKSQNVDLIELVDQIIEYFNIDYQYDLVKERDNIFLENKIVGRKKHIEQVIEFDENISRNLNKSNLILVEGEYGLGKSRFLKEMSHRLKLRNRNVYSIKANNRPEGDISDITGLLRQSMNSASNEIREKYRSEFSSILPELRLNSEKTKLLDVSKKAEKYRIYNRIANYFKDISMDKPIYLLIDDVENGRNDFLDLIDYLINSLRNSNVIFMLSYDKDKIQPKTTMEVTLKSWIKDLKGLEIKLCKLNSDEIGKIIKNIIGIAYVPTEFSSVLFKESEGNPKKIEDLINYLYNVGQLYMGKNGRWKLKIDDYSDIYIPANIDDSMLELLNIIQAKYYEIIKPMSIFQDLIHKSILIKILDIGSRNIETLLDELIRMKIIEAKLVDWGYSFSINNNELKKMIYYEIPQAERVELHAKAAEVIESFDGDLYESLFEEFLYQLIKSKQKDKALKVILNKINKIENKYGVQAKYLLDKAYNLISKDFDSEVKLEVLEKILDLSMLKAELNEENIYLNEYIELAQILNSTYHLLNYKKILSELHHQRGKMDLCEEQLIEIDKINNRENLMEFKIYSLSTHSLVDLHKGKPDNSRHKLEIAKDMAKDLQMNEELGNIYNRIGILESLKGNQKQATEFYKRSYKSFIDTENIIESVKPLNNLGNIYANHLNEVDKAIDYYEKGMEISLKYGFKKVQIVFSMNISEIYFNNYEYEKALEIIIEANNMALELKNANNIIACQSILGKIYLETSEFEKAYDCHKYIKSIFNDNDITDMEVLLGYYDFLGSFYLYLGDWDNAFDNENMALDLASKFNRRQYFKSKFKLILNDYFKNKKFNKEKVNRFIDDYKSTIYVEDFRETLMVLALLNVSIGDRLYAKEFLDIDREFKENINMNNLNKLRSIVTTLLKSDQDPIEGLIETEKIIRNSNFPFRNTINILVASRFMKNNKYKEAIKYYIEALENAYKQVIEIPEWDLRMSFIKSRKTDSIKNNIAWIINKVYGKTIDNITIDNIMHKENFHRLKDYFDLTDVIESIGKEEFSQITNIHSYGQAINIENIMSLLQELRDDYKYNLDLILNYIAKETFATKAFILECNKESNGYRVLSSLDGNMKTDINENIFRLANRSERGLLISSNIDSNRKDTYREYLTGNIAGIICVPIYANEIKSKSNKERRRYINNRDNTIGYIYLETNRAFNKFIGSALDIIDSILYLVFINLENNSLNLIATTDKLTGTYTRKYYEQLFKEFIENKKNDDYKFSLLMIDLDDFKNINDTYGHIKGDEVLNEIGNTIKSSVRSSDIVARYGGEEFVVILKDVEEEESVIIADKIRKNVDSLKIKGLKDSITLSIGVAVYPNHSKFKEDLLEKADQALYNAKQNGKNKVCLWNYKMGDKFESVDKLAGILTGTSEVDNKNILGILQIIQLLEEEADLKEKIYKYLGELLNVVDSETATIIILDKNGKKYYTRVKSNENFAETPILNKKIKNRVIKNKKGEFLIDWDNLDDVDQISGIPNWKSVIVVPMIKNGKVKGLTYLTTSLKQKEFDFNLLNLTKSYASVFTSLL